MSTAKGGTEDQPAFSQETLIASPRVVRANTGGRATGIAIRMIFSIGFWSLSRAAPVRCHPQWKSNHGIHGRQIVIRTAHEIFLSDKHFR
jgi:hypothetical protein